MSAALARAASKTDLPATPGLSPRAVHHVLAAMARIAQQDGTFRYGLRGSKIATLTEYCLSVVRRAQAYLVKLGVLERIEVGGGRASTKWRIVVDKLLSLLPEKTQQQATLDTAAVPKRHRSGAHGRLFVRMLGSRLTGDSSPEVQEVCEHGGDARLNSFGIPRCPGCRSQAART